MMASNQTDVNLEKLQQTVYLKVGGGHAVEIPFSAYPMPKTEWKFKVTLLTSFFCMADYHSRIGSLQSNGSMFLLFSKYYIIHSS